MCVPVFMYRYMCFAALHELHVVTAVWVCVLVVATVDSSDHCPVCCWLCVSDEYRLVTSRKYEWVHVTSCSRCFDDDAFVYVLVISSMIVDVYKYTKCRWMLKMSWWNCWDDLPVYLSLYTSRLGYLCHCTDIILISSFAAVRLLLWVLKPFSLFALSCFILWP